MRLFLLVCTVLMLCVSAYAASDYADFKDLAAEFDAKAHLEMGGPNGERFITAGPDYDRVQEVAQKLEIKAGNKLFECNIPVFLVADESFNAEASTSRVYVNIGLVKRCPDDNLLAPGVAHEIIHVMHNHLEKQYDKQVANARQIDSAVQAVNKPGYEENAKIVSKMGRGLISLFSLHYSRVDEEDADLGAFELDKDAGFDTSKGLGIFDMMGKGPKGILSNLSSHPAPEVRKALVVEGLKKYEAKEIAKGSALEATRGIEVIDAAPFAKMARENKFPGYAYRLVTKSNCLFVLCKGEGQLPSKHKKFSLSYPKAILTLPAGTKEIYLVAVNPIPGNYMGVLRVSTNPDVMGAGEDLYVLNTDNPHIDSMAIKIPIEALQPGEKYGFSLCLGKAPFPEGTGFNDNEDKIFNRTGVVTFEY